MADSVVLAEFDYWEDFTPDQVWAALRTYIEKGYAREERNEKYARGILRGQEPTQYQVFTAGLKVAKEAARARNEGEKKDAAQTTLRRRPSVRWRPDFFTPSNTQWAFPTRHHRLNPSPT